jgi:hypothetical protein
VQGIFRDNVSVSIHPRFNPDYYTYYLEGIREIFGGKALRYTETGFPVRTTYEDGLAFIAESPRPMRVYLAANDHARIDPVALAWCDRYGIVNLDPADAQIDPRVRAIGPNFGVRSERLRCDLRTALAVLQGGGWAVGASLGIARALGRRLWDRLPVSSYVPAPSETGYVFFAAWPWLKHPEVNPPRARFIEACREVRGLRFEGGFVPRRRNDVPGLEGLLAPRRYPFRHYRELLGRSAVAFNCPAVHGCLGWKLGEFLALGKAIISTPLGRAMPAPLVHGTHVHFVEDSMADMRAAVERIAFDQEYRRHLEWNARRYFLDHLAPARVILGLLGCGATARPPEVKER